jgi:hypothetical protein
LGKLTLISAPNRKGKTTITTALTLAALGYWPRLGKTNKATFRLASGPTMHVSAKFDNGVGAAPGPSNITRTWKQSGKSVNATETGEAPEIGALLNPDVFIGAKPADKIAMLASLCTGDDSKEYTELLAAITAAGGKVPVGENGFTAAETTADGLEEKARDAKREVTQWTKTMGGIAELINATIPKKARTGAQEALETAIRASQAAASALAAIEAKSESGQDAADELSALGDISDAVADPSAMHTAEKEMIAADELVKQAVSRHSFTRGELDKLKTKFPGSTREGFQAEHDATVAAGDPTEDLAATKAAISQAKDRKAETASALKESRRLSNDAELKLAGLVDMEACPTCLACGDGWKVGLEQTLRAVVEKEKPNGDKLFAEINELEEKIASLTATQNAEEKQAAAWARLPRLKDILANFDEIDKGEAALATFAAEVTAARAVLEPAAAKFENESQAFTAANAGEANRRRAAELRAIMAAAPTDEEANAAASAAAAAEANETKAREDLAAEEEHNKEHAEAMQREKDLAEAQEKLVKAEADAKEHTEKAKALRVKMRAAMKSLFGPVLKFAAPLSRAVMDNELSLNADGEIGVQLPGSFVPFECLSGEEQIIATIAIQAGLSAAVGRVVMLDEFSRVDSDDKPKLANALIGMVTAGTLSQVIIIDHDAKFAETAAANGWTVLRP